LFKQLDHCGDVFLFSLGEVVPPILKFVSILDLPFHIRNIANEE